jgi:basic membrane lipoprotein Med (substrate-binding protein (PBP1-ABC) superfamily)
VTPPIKVGYIPTAPESIIGPTTVYAAIQSVAQDFGWNVEIGPDEVQAFVQSSGATVVVVIAGLNPQVAREFPNVYFVYLPPPTEDLGSDLPPNLLALGGPESRQDQAGFLAGMAAGFATEKKFVTAISDPNSAEGRKYRNGFLHGVRYACPKCRVDFIDVADTADTQTASAEAAQYVLFGSDVFFAAAGQAGDEALVAAAQNGGWVIGSGSDVYLTIFGNGSIAGADRVLTSVYLDPGGGVRAALTAFHNGTPLYGAQPFSAANGAIVLAPYHNTDGPLNALEQSYIAVALARLADGSLETGIDPATGKEK